MDSMTWGSPEIRLTRILEGFGGRLVPQNIDRVQIKGGGPDSVPRHRVLRAGARTGIHTNELAAGASLLPCTISISP